MSLLGGENVITGNKASFCFYVSKRYGEILCEHKLDIRKKNEFVLVMYAGVFVCETINPDSGSSHRAAYEPEFY